VEIAGQPTEAWAFDPDGGGIHPTMRSGRPPLADDEIVLGADWSSRSEAFFEHPTCRQTKGAAGIAARRWLRHELPKSVENGLVGDGFGRSEETGNIRTAGLAHPREFTERSTQVRCVLHRIRREDHVKRVISEGQFFGAMIAALATT
jgi:hypothetical protein